MAKERRTCEDCESKLGGYGPCLVCNPIEKGDKNDYDLMQMFHTIEHIYGYDYRSYEAELYPQLEGKSSTSFNVDNSSKWEFKNYELVRKFRDNVRTNGYNEEGCKFSNSPEGMKFHREMHAAYDKAPDGKCLEVPYMDFWHSFLAVYSDLHNDSWMVINWGTVRDNCTNQWELKICADFIDRFGEEDIFVAVCW